MLAIPHLGLVPRERHGVVVDQHHATCHTLVVVLQPPTGQPQGRLELQECLRTQVQECMQW